MRGIYFAGNFLSKKRGGRAICEELAERFSLLGWDVITASSKTNRISRMIDFLWTSWKFREKYQIALVDVFSDLGFQWSEILCFFLRIIHKPYILTLRGGKLPEFAENNFNRVRKHLNSARLVTTPSKYLYKSFISFRDDIKYIPNGINIGHYAKRVLDHGGQRLVWLRAFHDTYKPALAIEVLASLIEDFPNARLTMIGPDKGDGSFQETINTIKNCSIEENVKVLGAIPKLLVPKYLSEGDIFLNTTIYESFGVSVQEAAACGLCIVTTNVGELSYLWEDGIDALLVPPNDPKAMAAAVRRILMEPALAERLSINARAKAEQYDWAVVLPQWEKSIEEISN